MKAHFLRPCLQGSQSFSLHNETTAATVASTLIPAFDRKSRNQGLLGRTGLPPDAALVIAPCSAVHTWFMRFAIDVVFVSRSGEVLKVCRSVPPWRIAIRLGAFAVIEMADGCAAKVRNGHKLSVRVVS